MTDPILAQSLNGFDVEVENLMDRLTRLCAAKQAVEKNFEHYRPVLEMAFRVYGENAWRWLARPARSLLGKVPIELAEDDIDSVLTLLGQIEGGVYI